MASGFHHKLLLVLTVKFTIIPVIASVDEKAEDYQRV